MVARIGEANDSIYFESGPNSGILPLYEYRITGIKLNNKQLIIVDRNKLFRNLRNDCKSQECQLLPSYSLPYPLFNILYIISMMASFTLYHRYCYDAQYTSNFSLIIFSHVRKLYLRKFQPQQYPQLYTYILAHFVVASNSSNITTNKVINTLDEVLQCLSFGLKNLGPNLTDPHFNAYEHINKLQKSAKENKLIENGFFRTPLIVSALECMYHACDHSRGHLRCNSALLHKYTIIAVKYILLYEDKFTIYDLYQGRTKSLPPLYIVGGDLFCSGNVIHNRKIDITIIKSVLKKFAYWLLAMEFKVLSTFCECNIWQTLGALYLYREIDVKKAILCFKYALISLEYASTMEWADELSSVICQNKYITYRYLLKSYFLLGQWKKVFKIITICEKMLQLEMCNTFINQSTKVDFTTWKSNMFELKQFKMQRKLCESDDFRARWMAINDFAFFREKGIESLFVEYIINKKYCNNMKNMITLKNIAMLKQCNWKHCMRKSTVLRRCAKCKSVFYCSKLCQKKDWSLSTHKNDCKKLSSRCYSLTVK